jgi:tRNA (guanine-N7-)-methyltransferase
VERAQKWASALQLDRSVQFLVSNATVSFGPVLETYPGKVELATILHPDPHFKKKHKKRRVVQPGLIAEMAR